MPGFKEATALNSSLQALYDGITFTPDTYKDSGLPLFSLYATSLNLNSNPYMSFAFEFGGELKGKQDQITVTFTYTVNGTEYTYTTTPPASVDADGDGVIDEINKFGVCLYLCDCEKCVEVVSLCKSLCSHSINSFRGDF